MSFPSTLKRRSAALARWLRAEWRPEIKQYTTPRFRPRLEQLEDRTTPAVDFTKAIFEIDGNAIQESAVREDWANVFNGTDTALATTFIGEATEKASTDVSYFTGGGSKDINDISDWLHSTGDVAPDKDQLTNAYAAAYVQNNDLVVYFGADRYATNGDAQIGFWFFQDKVGLVNPTGSGGFTGQHKVGDVLVLSDFTQGGATATIRVFKWVGGTDGDSDGDGKLDGPLQMVSTGANATAAVNTASSPSPWPYHPKSGKANSFPDHAFFEGSVNLTALGLEGCFTSFMAETRSSQSVSAQLKDFALGQFELCDARISISPDGVNEVGSPHTFTVSVEKKDLDTHFSFGAAVGAQVVVSVSNSNGAAAFFNDAVDSDGDGNALNDTVVTTGVDGTAQVVINSPTGGITVATAKVDVPLSDGDFLTVSTDGTDDNSGPATKRWVDASIALSPPTATNEVGDEHTVTATVKQNDGSGAFVSAANGTVVTFSLANDSGAAAAFIDDGVDSDGDGITGNDAVVSGGKASVKLVSESAGMVTINAATTFNVAGLSLTRDTDPATSPGSGPNGSGPVTKRYVDASIALNPPTATNEVGDEHVVTATVTQDDGSGSTADAPDGTVVVFSLANANGAAATFVDDGVDSNGDGITGNDALVSGGAASIRLVSDSAGLVTINAATTFSVGGVSLTRDTDPVTTAGSGPDGSDPATKRYVDASIALSPPTATNGIGEAHTITATVRQNDGSGAFANAPDGTVVVFSLANSGGAAADFIDDGVDSNGDGINGNDAIVSNGRVSVQLVSQTAGLVTINATTTFNVGGISLTRDTSPATGSIGSGPGGSGPVTKRYVDGTLRWLKTDGANKALAGATFSVTRTHTFNSQTGQFVDTPDVTFAVQDNSALDKDSDAGELQLTGLILGRYAIKETIAPVGYTLDPDTETVSLSLANPSNADGTAGDVVPVFVNNLAARGQITPTGTDIQDFLSGTATQLTEYTYTQNADGTIARLSGPGAMFYFSYAAVKSTADVVTVSQTTNFPVPFAVGAVQVYSLQGVQIKGYKYTIQGGNVVITGLKPGEYILRIQYRPPTAPIGFVANGAQYNFSFETLVNGQLFDKDPDGLILRKL